MINKKNKQFNLITAFFSAFVILLSGCSTDADAEQSATETSPSIRVISDGTLSEDVKQAAEYATFYIPEKMVTPYGSAFLMDNEKDLYESLKNVIGNFEPESFLEIDANTYSKILDLLRIEELSYSHVSSQKVGDYVMTEGKFKVNFEYNFTPEEMTRMNIAAEKRAAEIMNGVTDDMNEYETIKYLHDTILQNCVSDTTDPYTATIYGALVNGAALCEGYSKAFSYLCNLAGIENIIIVGSTVDGETYTPHMWNMVKYGGNWYHIDLTWDKPDETLASKYPDFVSYQYFLVNDTVIQNDHIPSSHLFNPPEANASYENYFTKEGFTIENESETDNVIAAALIDAAQNSRSFASVKCASNDLFIRTTADIAAAGRFDEIADIVRETVGKEISFSYSTYYSSYRIISFFIY